VRGQVEHHVTMRRIVGGHRRRSIEIGDRQHDRPACGVRDQQAIFALLAERDHTDRLPIAHVADRLAYHARTVLELANRDRHDRAARIGGDQRVFAVERGELHGPDGRPGLIDAMGDMENLEMGFAARAREGIRDAAQIRWRRPWLRHVFADGGYAGQKLRDAIACHGDWTIEIIKRSDAIKGFEILPRRWSSSAPSHGWGDAAASRKTGKRPSLHQPHGRWSRPSACSPDEPQGAAMLEKLVNQALNG
jgi:transposase